MLKVGNLAPSIICDHSRFNHSVQDKLDPERNVVFILALVFAVPSDFQVDRRCHSQPCRFRHQECIATFFCVLFFQLSACIAVRPLAIDELVQVSQLSWYRDNQNIPLAFKYRCAICSLVSLPFKNG